MTLARIINSNATVNADYAAMVNGAFAELAAAAGFWPQVLTAAETAKAGLGTSSGGTRTQAECDAAGTSWTQSDHYEDTKAANGISRCAVDINNQRSFRNVLGDALFEAILAKHGLYNMQTNGAPFPNEPWHFAGHVIIHTAGDGIAPLDNTESEEFIVKEVIYCSDIRNVGGKTDDKGAWVVYGQPASSADHAVIVTHDESAVNQLLRPRGKSAADLPNLSYGILSGALKLAVGFDSKKDGSTTAQDGGLMVDGFTWPPK